MKINFRHYLPHAIAVLVFAMLTLIYFKPLLSGKELRQHDIAMHKGMSKEIADYREKHHAEPLWTNSMFGGMPAYLVSTLYPGNWLSGLDKAFKLFLPHPGGYLFLLCLGFFILLLCLEVDPWLALIGALAYGLSTYFLSIIQAGHNSKANALGYLPALIGGIVLIFRGKHWLGLSITALFTAMEINAGHVQISYYGYMIVGFVLLGYFVGAFKTKALPVFFKSLLFFSVASLIGLLPNAGNLMTTNEYGKLSNRGKAELTINPDRSSNKTILSGGLDKDYATGWSYGVSESFSFLIPDFKGGGNRAIGQVDKSALKKVDPESQRIVSQLDVYYGDQPLLSAPDYSGAIIIFLAFAALLFVRNPLKWPLVLVTVLAVLLSWGHNFMALTSFFMDYVPGYNKFRAVSMIMVIPELVLPLLAVLCVSELIEHKSWEDLVQVPLLKKSISIKKVLIISLAVTGGFCFLGYLVPDAVNTFLASNEEAKMYRQFVNAGFPEDQAREKVAEVLPQLEIARKAIFKSDAVRSLIFILLGFAALFAYFTRGMRRELLFAALGIFVLIDLWTVDQRYLNDRSFVTKAENQQYISGKTAADEEILKDPDPDYRVLNLTVSPFDDASTSYYHKSIGGYHGAKLRRYVDLISFHLTPEINTFYQGINTAGGNDSLMRVLFSKLPVLNALNTKYLILPVGEEGDRAIPIKNTEANGHAWFVKELRFVQNPDSEIVSLYNIDTKSVAILNESAQQAEAKIRKSYPATGTIALSAYEPNNLVYKSNSASEEFAVFSEIYYEKGWNAYVDGQLQKHLQTDYVLRGMVVPAGAHTIEFKFEPMVYKTGNSIALVGSIILLLAVAGGIYLQQRNKVIVS
jgi:hypothetical protein